MLNVVVTSMSADEARKYFMRPENYFTVPLPSYFDFGKVLSEADKKIGEHRLEDFCNFTDTSGLSGVNFTLMSGKDGGYAGREFQLMHPAIYVEMVRVITEPANWERIKERLRLFRRQKVVFCSSVVPWSEEDKGDAAAAILRWWHGMEQGTIKMALYYSHMAETDIRDCYNSVDLKTIGIALGEVGAEVCKLIKMMMCGKTTGIPQGSALMDFLAEAVLGYIDVALANALKSEHVKGEYTILRYRDDYRVFAKDEVTVQKIARVLAETLLKFGMKLNEAKTRICDDILMAARKSDKDRMDEWRMMQAMGENYTPSKMSIQKCLLEIYRLAVEFPNAGGVQRAMVELYRQRIFQLEHKPRDAYQIMSIVVNIMAKNPRTYQIGVAILGKIVSFNPGISRKSLAGRVLEKARTMPNTDYLEVWLQRLTIKNRPGRKYKCKLCQLVYNHQVGLWNSEWLKIRLHENAILDRKEIKRMKFVLPVEEVQVFMGYDDNVFEEMWVRE